MSPRLAFGTVALIPRSKLPMAKKRTPTTKAAGAKMRPAKRPSAQKPAESVDAFLQNLAPPLKDVLQLLRKAILSASPTIDEGIKWNAPSFRTTEWFATMNVRSHTGEDRLWLILHAGAKAGPDLQRELSGVAPAGWLKWLGKDRARVAFADAADVRAKQPALKKLLRAWIRLI